MTTRGSLFRLILLALLWGSSFLWIKLGLSALSPVQLVLLRVALGAAVLLVLCRVGRLRLPRGRTVWLHLAVTALFANAAPFVLFGIGEQTVDSGMAGVLNATTPLWTLLVTLLAVRHGERQLGIMRMCGLLLGFGGILLIFAPWRAAGTSLWGAVAILGASLCYGIGGVYASRHLVGRGISPTAQSTAQMLLATAMCVVVMPVAGLRPIHFDLVGLLGVAVLGVFGTGIAFVLYYRLLTDEGPTTASTVTYLVPIFSVLLGALVLGERINLRIGIGMVVVLVGVGLTRRAPRPAVPEARAVAEPVETG